MSASVMGLIDWSGGRDREGYLELKARWKVITDTMNDGPWNVANAAGLPLMGSPWLIGDDFHPYCFCMPDLAISKASGRQDTDIHELYWIVEQTYSNRPLKRCNETQIENPLWEPPRISGGFVKATREMGKDRNGDPFKTSSHEIIRGQAVEFDESRATVTISLNTEENMLATFYDMQDTVNDATLWGLDPRMIKLSNVTWERKLWGLCTYYFTTTYEFEVNKRTWDRRVTNEGTRCLAGHSPGSPMEPLDPDAADPDLPGKTYKENPKRFEVYKDINGENTRCFLDAKGRPLSPDDPIVELTLEYYEESNFLLLGIPSSLA